MSKTITATLSAVLALSALNCASEEDPLDSENAPFPAGKTDGGIDPGSPEAQAVLALVNDSTIGFAELDDDARLHATAAANIILYREGADGIDGSSDDEVYDDLKELDAVSYVGPAALERLLEYAIQKGLLVDDTPTPDYDYEIDVESVWTEVSGTVGKQSLAILGDDAYSHSGHIVIYGEKNNKLRVRDFQGSWWISTNPGDQISSQDNWYSLEAEFTSPTEMTVKLVGRTGKTYDLVYKRETMTNALENDATEAINDYYEKYDELRDADVSSIAKLKSHIRLHLRTHDFGPNDHWDAYEYQLEVFWLQLEAYLDMSDKDPALAGVDVEADGSDAISQHFLASNGATGFTSDNDLQDPEDVLDGWDWASGDPEFFVVVPGIEGLDSGPMRQGMEKYVTHTFKRLTAFECEDNYDYTPDFTWYLKDGTVVTYHVGTECG